jgi:hypothetical protein
MTKSTTQSRSATTTTSMATAEQEQLLPDLPERDSKTPHPYDVVLGRGTGVAQHFGNAFFRRLVDEHRVTYQQAPKTQKGDIARSIVQAIARQGGSFVEAVTTVGGSNSNKSSTLVIRYRSVPFPLALGKTSQALRELKISGKRKTKIQQAMLEHSPTTALKQQAPTAAVRRVISPVPVVGSRAARQVETHVPPCNDLTQKKKRRNPSTNKKTVTPFTKKTPNKKKKSKRNGYTTAEWDAVLTPPPKKIAQGLATPPPPTKPRHCRTTRAAIQAQKHAEEATSGALPVKKRPLLKGLLCQEEEKETGTAAHQNNSDESTVSTRSHDEFMPIVPSPTMFSNSVVSPTVTTAFRDLRLSLQAPLVSTGNRVPEEIREHHERQDNQHVVTHSTPSRWNVAPDADEGSKSSPSLSLGQIDTIASEGVASPLEEERVGSSMATSPTYSVTQHVVDWGQAPCPLPPGGNPYSATSAFLVHMGRMPADDNAVMGPPARAVGDTPRMKISANYHMSMVTPSSTKLMTSPPTFGLGTIIPGTTPWSSPFLDQLWNENGTNNYYGSMFDPSQSRPVDLLNRPLGDGVSSSNGMKSSSSPQTTPGMPFAAENAGTTPESYCSQPRLEDHVIGSPGEQMSLDLCCVFCSPGKGHECACPRPFRTSAGLPSAVPNNGQWSSAPITSNVRPPIGKEIYVPPAALYGGAALREASPSPRRMFASAIRSPSVPVGASGTFYQVVAPQTSHRIQVVAPQTSHRIQSPPSGLSTDTGFSRWTPSPLFPVASRSSSPNVTKPRSDERRTGIDTLLEAAMAAKVLNFEDLAASKQHTKCRSSGGTKKRKATSSPSDQHRTPKMTARKRIKSQSTIYVPTVVEVAQHSHGAPNPIGSHGVPTRAGNRPPPRRVSDVTSHHMGAPVTAPVHPGACLFMMENQSRSQSEEHSPQDARFHGPNPGRRVSDASAPSSGNHGLPIQTTHMPLVSDEANYQQAAAAAPPMATFKPSRRVSC